MALAPAEMAREAHDNERKVTRESFLIVHHEIGQYGNETVDVRVSRV